MNKPNPSEQRKSERIKISIPVRISLKYGGSAKELVQLSGRTLDLTEEGVSLITSQPVSTGTTISVLFPVEDIAADTDKRAIQIEGIVYSVTPWQHNDYRLGVYFGQADEERENKFFDIICSPAADLPASQIPPFPASGGSYGRRRFLWSRWKPHAILNIFSGLSL